MAETQRLGLEMFGGYAGGQISDRDYKFSNRDRQIVDNFLAALEGHRHVGGSPLADPTTYPPLTLNPSSTTGTLPGGQTLFYVVSYIDEWGLETAMSAEASVDTPDPYPTPPAPAVSPRSGGGLTAGTYYYQITYTQTGTSGEVLETLASPLTVVTLASVNHTARVNLPPLPAGASGWQIYRMGSNDPYAFLVATVTTTTATFWDDAGTVPTTSIPPLENTTNSQNVVQVTIPDAGLLTNPVTNGQIRRWRVYRTTTAGDYSDTALVHEVVETVNETAPYGALVSSWLDDGSPLRNGSPLLVSTTFNPPDSAQATSGAGSMDYTPLGAGLIQETNVEAALHDVDQHLQAEQPRVCVTLAAADAITANNWGVAAISGLGWIVPQEFDGWVVENMSAGLVAPLTAGSVTVYMTHAASGSPTTFASCDQGVAISATGTAWGQQYGVQGTPYTSAHVVHSGDILRATTTAAGPTPTTAAGSLNIVLRRPTI